MTNALVFEVEPPVAAPQPNRVDIACFVGWVARRGGSTGSTVPATIAAWLAERGWLPRPNGLRPPFARDDALVLRDVPVPIRSWDAFDRLFAWDARPSLGGETTGTYLGAAVRSFFAEGGRLCYVVRMGDPWALDGRGDTRAPNVRAAERDARLAQLVPGWPRALSSEPVDPSSWHGVGHLFGLPDVSFVCLPDLADVLRTPWVAPDRRRPVVVVAEQFLPCSTNDALDTIDDESSTLRAPRCDEDGFATWSRVITMVRDAIVRRGCETQLVAGVPLPLEGSTAERDLPRQLADGTLLGDTLTRGARGSSFVQTAWPWLRTRGSLLLPESIESPEGALVGMLARNALSSGTWRSVAGQPLADAFDVYPPLRGEWVRLSPEGSSQRTLLERVTLLGPSVRGMQVLSDVTPAREERWRAAGAHRLLSAIVRAARQAGEDVVFDPSGEALWTRLRAQLSGLLLALYREGALRGATPADAFSVRCDRTTTTQADLDAGRLVVEIELDPALPIERIVVALSLEASGEVAVLRAAGVGVAEAA